MVDSTQVLIKWLDSEAFLFADEWETNPYNDEFANGWNTAVINLCGNLPQELIESLSPQSKASLTLLLKVAQEFLWQTNLYDENHNITNATRAERARRASFLSQPAQFSANDARFFGEAIITYVQQHNFQRADLLEWLGLKKDEDIDRLAVATMPENFEQIEDLATAFEVRFDKLLTIRQAFKNN